MIGIVGECVEIFALDHDRARVVVGAGIEARTLIGNRDLLLVYSNDGKVLQYGAPRINRYTLRLGEGKAPGGDGDGVGTGGELGKDVGAIGTALHRGCGSILRLKGDGRFGDTGAGGIGHDSVERGGRGQGKDAGGCEEGHAEQ